MMIRNRRFFVIGLSALAAVIFCGVSIVRAEQSLEEIIESAKSGIEAQSKMDKAAKSVARGGNGLATDTIPQDSVLLIPNVTNKTVGMYDPFDGDYLGILITDPTHLATPICAMKGPGGNIYVSDQISDGAFVYDTSGAFLFTFCDGTDGLNNIRGIDFRGDTLFLTSGDDYVARFDAPHNRLMDFINGGMEPYDVYFLDDDRALIADNGGDNVRIYNADGTFAGEIFSVDFPMQIVHDKQTPGDFLNEAFLSANVVTDFDLDGTIQQSTAFLYPRGVYRLGNGNILVTSNHTSHSGVYEIEPGTGNIIEQKNSGDGFRFIELYIKESGTPPTGRCCYNDNADCVDTTEAACTLLGGNWNAGLNCTDNPCPTGGGCDYVPGDVNGVLGFNGLDITYGVAYFKGGPSPICDTCNCPPHPLFWVCGDVNNSCTYNGLDITYGVAYFKGGPAPMPCADCPPNP